MAGFNFGAENEEERVRRNKYCCGCSVFIAFISILLFALSWDTLEPTDYGLVRNGFSGTVDMTKVYDNGRYFIWLRHEFLRFPKHLVTLSYGERDGDDRPPIPALTGPDEALADEADDPDEKGRSGGQPIALSVSFQYQIDAENVANIYRSFGMDYDSFYLRAAQQAITNVAQQFTPSMFWLKRRDVETALRIELDRVLFEQGFVHVPQLQLRKIEFDPSYEETITGIQLQEQLKVTKGYQLKVVEVLKSVDRLQTETDATVMLIDAEAAKEAAVIVNKANSDALELEQMVKAEMYAQLKEQMGWNATQFLEYVKMEALNTQPASNVVVGVDPIGQVR